MTEPSPFLAADQTPVDAAPDIGARTLAFLFSDIEGSTRLEQAVAEVRRLAAEGAAMSVDQVVAYALGDRPWPAS
jgi:hypothetical protein